MRREGRGAGRPLLLKPCRGGRVGRPRLSHHVGGHWSKGAPPTLNRPVQKSRKSGKDFSSDNSFINNSSISTRSIISKARSISQKSMEKHGHELRRNCKTHFRNFFCNSSKKGLQKTFPCVKWLSKTIRH